jgi:hypothetical protein
MPDHSGTVAEEASSAENHWDRIPAMGRCRGTSGFLAFKRKQRKMNVAEPYQELLSFESLE